MTLELSVAARAWGPSDKEKVGRSEAWAVEMTVCSETDT